jgi:hypothetical protein
VSLALAILLHAVAAFETRTIPLANDDAAVFLGPAESAATRTIAVQEGSKVTLYALQGDSRPRQAILPQGVTAYDIADIDGDQQSELVGVAGKQVLRIPLSIEPAPPSTLFSADSVLAGDSGRPYLYPLVLSIGGHIRIGMPRSDQIDLYTPAGEASEHLPLRRGEEEEPDGDFSSFAWSEGNTLSWNVCQRAEFYPELPPDGRYTGAERAVINRHVFAHPTSLESPTDWPWFPIRKSGDDILKAHFSMPLDIRQETKVAIRSMGPQAIEDPQKEAAPFYTYPGALVSTWDPPDFNGDGYNDMLLVRFVYPGASVGALVRSLTNATTPFDLTVHLYRPDLHRFDPRPTSLMSCRINILSLLEGETFKGLVMRDFDGDGHADLALVPNDKQVLVWLWHKDGFQKEPDYSKDFSESIRAVAFEEKLGTKPGWSFGLITEHSLVVMLYSGDS